MQKLYPLIFIALCCVVLPANSQDFEVGQIVVSGTAEISVPADNVTFSFTSRFESNKSSEAIEVVRKKIEKITNDLYDLGVTNQNLSTGNFRSEKIRYRKDEKRFGQPDYFASLTVTVDLDSLGLLESAITAISKHRPYAISDVNYNLKNFEEHKLHALAKAVDMAKVKAEILGSRSGAKLGKVLHVSEIDNSRYGSYRMIEKNIAFSMSDSSNVGHSGSFHQRSAKISASVKLIMAIEDLEE